ncbi:pentapeptide repeat-containing protein [Novispirillum sp. DQ9]|uniref:pentapeptide repeat-containing protein n=1 Tax=Novispirillum sp. DQ9 TaxID=3398612 RepID=UPI003C7CA134
MPGHGSLSHEDLLGILERHRLWVDSRGEVGEQADLRRLTFVGRSFWRADLRQALLDDSDLSGADLDHADLRGASLSGARLDGASLWEAKLGQASLVRACLRKAKLDHADLRGADLTGADLTDASLRETLLDPVPVDLDAHRGMASQKATEDRRRTVEVEADRSARDQRLGRLEDALAAGPAATWLEVGEKVQFLAALFAATAEGQDPRHQKLVAGLLEDIRRLSAPPP